MTFRGFKRYKASFLINLIGLSAGLACALLIYLWVDSELTMDKFHQKDERLYQVMENFDESGNISTIPYTPGPLAKSLAADFPEVEYAVTVREPVENINLSIDDRNVRGTGRYASQDFFNIFSYNLIHGDKKSVLADKNSIVISERLSIGLFNTTENVLGKTIEFQHEQEFIVTGVFQNVPANSTDQFDFILSYQLFEDTNPWVREWHNNPTYTFLTLKPGANAMDFNRKISSYVKTKTNGEVKHSTEFIKRFSERYLYGRYENGVEAGGRISYVKIFSIVAITIIVIACINFMNLSTARASRRLKEVGVKKALGISRTTLALQYLGESLLLTFVSLVVALIFVYLFIPHFNEITGKRLHFSLDVKPLLWILSITLLTGILSGSYPALYLSGFKPAVVLKGKLHKATGEVWARKGLVTLQFTTSIIMIVAVLVIYKQLKFIQTKNLGYNKDNIISFKREGILSDKKRLETFLSEVEKTPGVIKASSIGNDLTGSNSSTWGLSWPGKNPEDKTSFENVAVDYGMMEALGIQIKEGRLFSRDFGADSASLIFNEAGIKHMGLEKPIGETIWFWGRQMKIVGVVKDFHFESLHEQVKPLLFRVAPDNTNLIMVKIQNGNEREVIAETQNIYQSYNPGFSFDYRFLEDDYQSLYLAEKRVSVLSGYFTGLAVLISCLGLFGLATFTAERKLKEIGIRKILGSSNFSIVRLLTREFTPMVLIAIVAAIPLSYLLATRWLSDFAYKIDLQWWFFAGAALLVVFFTWLTIGFQIIKASTINPTQSLKEE